MVFRKKLKSLERRWEKISKFLANLPSEQIFYRNIPLGAPERLSNRSRKVREFVYECICSITPR